jgi:hypothetical protein
VLVVLMIGACRTVPDEVPGFGSGGGGLTTRDSRAAWSWPREIACSIAGALDGPAVIGWVRKSLMMGESELGSGLAASRGWAPCRS